jgi:hemoglobin/transferrin/lactoferrin receptor protein
VPTATRYPNGSSWRSLAAYISYHAELSSKLNFTGGLRYNHNNLQANFDTSFFKFPFTSTSLNKGSLTGNLGLVYKATNRWQFSALASSGFRMPNIDDIGKVFESAPGFVVVPNPTLQSEYAWNLELGTKYSIDQTFNAFANVFYTLLDNALTRRAFKFNGQDSILFDGIKSKVEAIQNVAQARVWGLQLGWEWWLSKTVRWQTRLNWIKGNETDDTKDVQVPLRHAPPFYGSTALQYQHSKWLIELNVQYNSEISNANLAPSEQAKPAIYAVDANGKPYCPAWYTLNLKAGYQVSEKITANIGWENITDQRYRPYSSGIVAPGSNVILSLRVQF